jgi:large subunit ribosomal protein L1
MEYSIKEAIKAVKNNSTEKFDATVEVHINLNIDKSQSVRFTTTLPHGTGKERKIAVFASKQIEGADLQLKEEDIASIEKGDLKPGEDFDVLIAEPSFMSKVAKVAPILGPAGLMPNPKSGTVTEDVEQTVKEFKLGQIEIRTEPSAPIIHTIIGKVSWEEDKLIDNLNALITGIRQNKPQKAKVTWIESVFVKSSMGKAHKVNL